MKDRVILAFDLDCFYVACERLLQPSLVGLPIGIQQKSILATCSYEARAKGVKKLGFAHEAKKMCPDLVLINGEDLTNYRAFSRRIFKLVKRLVDNSPVERLGMDELFVDATDLVHLHMRDLQQGSTSSSRQFFNLQRHRAPGTATDSSRGFFYNASEPPPGYFYPPDASDTAGSEAYRLGAHLAHYIRQCVLDELGFTTSAGIAPNKVLAKLLASVHKPARQTCWNTSPSDATSLSDFMSPLSLNKIPGFGYRTIHVIRHNLFGDALPTMVFSDEHTAIAEQEQEQTGQERPLLVSHVRANATLSDFKKWLDPKTGERLHCLLFGQDDEPVQMSPDHPSTISVEDSFSITPLRTAQEAKDNILLLAFSLLRRLEIELVDEPDEQGEAGLHKFVRFPTVIRLVLRFGRMGRESKSAAMPSEIFDMHIPRQARSEILFKSALEGLWTSMSAGKDVSDLKIINLAAVQFVTEPPPKDVRLLFSKPASKRKRVNVEQVTAENVDRSVLDALPPELREEMLKELGIVETSKKKSKKQLVKCEECGQTILPFGSCFCKPTEMRAEAEIQRQVADASRNLCCKL